MDYGIKNMLKIQEFIDCFDAVEEAAVYLKRNLRIDTTIHSLEDEQEKLGPFTLFKPGHSANLSNALVREANCLILDDDNEILAKAWNYPEVVKSPSQGFPENFNLGKDTIGYEVPDGDIVVIYNVDGEWIIGTADHPLGDNYIAGMDLPGFTYAQEIKRLLTGRYHSGWSAPFKTTNPMLCFICYYVSPYLNKIMPLLTHELHLMSVINLETGHELSPGMVDGIAANIDLPRPSWSEVNGMTSLSNRLYNNMRTLSPGFMLVDKNDQHVFIPNPIYTAVKSAKDVGRRVRPTHIASILQATRDKRDITSVSASFENFEPMLRLLFDEREELWKELVRLWNSAHAEKSTKDFAEIIHHHPLNYLLFMYRDNRISNLRTQIAKLKPIKLISIIKNKRPKEFELASRLLKFTGGNEHGVEEKDSEDLNEKEEGCIPFTQAGD